MGHLLIFLPKIKRWGGGTLASPLSIPSTWSIRTLRRQSAWAPALGLSVCSQSFFFFKNSVKVLRWSSGHLSLWGPEGIVEAHLHPEWRKDPLGNYREISPDEALTRVCRKTWPEPRAGVKNHSNDIAKHQQWPGPWLQHWRWCQRVSGHIQIGTVKSARIQINCIWHLGKCNVSKINEVWGAFPARRVSYPFIKFRRVSERAVNG